ncbi:helix-turn-helix domain-containing protein [Streptomyces niveus]|uniref:helix-turn-helix domain-containing protein n=1 Tax=Streptomyces niveus TaxID=193462 RepID=UPI0033AD7084
MSSSESDRVQSVRNAWTNMLRAEVLRHADIADLPRVAAVGVWLATFADADGSNAFPSRETLARLAGCSQETVTKAVSVLLHVGLLARRRRPNASAVYQLLTPMERPDWGPHMHLITDTRQRRAHAAKKQRDAEARTASTDAVRTATVAGVPDSVRGGGSELPEEAPESVRGRPRTASTDAVRTASVAGVYQYPSTYGRDPLPDEDVAGLSPQPQAAGAREDEGTIPPPSQPDTTEQDAPPLHALPTPPGTQAKSSGQRPLLLSVRAAAEISAEERAALRRDATPAELGQAVAELGRKEAIALYGIQLLAPYLIDHGLEGDAREAQ